MNDSPAPSLADRLSAPFDQGEVKFKPQVVSGNRAMAICYVDARVIQDRLDDVLGVDGWQDDYEALPDGSVICRLRLKIGKRWIIKADVGGPSEQPDGGDRMKAAFSDALKRAAVKFGIGRYLYRAPAQWVDYDPQKKQFTQKPRVPGAPAARKTAAVPAGKPAEPTAQTVTTAPANGHTAAQPPAANGHSAAPRPPAVPAHDPTEVLTQADHQVLTQLLFRHKVTWPKISAWLSGNDPSWPADGKSTDLTYGQAGRIRKALDKRAANKQGQPS